MRLTLEIAPPEPVAVERRLDARRPQRMNLQPSDLELLERVAAADREAFRLFYDRHAPQVLAYVRSLGRSRDASEALTGAVISVAREDLEAPAAGEYFQGDLVGLEVVDVEGRRLGRVREVWSSGPVPNLVIDTDSGELMVPFAEEFVPKVDLSAGRVTVIVPEMVG